MANKVTLQMEAEEARAIQGVLKVVSALKGTETAFRGVNRRARQSRQEVDLLSKAFQGVSGSVVGMVAGMASLGTAISVFRQWEDHLNRIKNLQVQIGERGLGMQRTVLSLAEQEDLTGPEGIMEGVRRAMRTANAASVSLEVAKPIREAAMSTKKMPAAAREEVAKIAASIIGKTGGTGEEGAAIVELLGAANIQTVEGARQAGAELLAAMLGTIERGAGKFGEATIRGAIPMISAGAPLSEALAFSSQGRSVAGGSAEAGAELTRQIFQNLSQDKHALSIVQRHLGLASIDEARTLRPDVFLKGFQGALQKARAEGGEPAVTMLLKELDAREITQARRFFSPGAIESGELVRQMVGQADPAEMDRLFAEFARTDVAVAQRQENQRQLRQAEFAHRNFRRTERRKQAEFLLEQQRAGGKIGFLDDLLLSDERLLQNLEPVVELEALGLVPPGKLGPDMAFGEGWSEGMARQMHERLGIAPDDAILSLDQLDVNQLKKLRAVQAVFEERMGFAHEKKFHRGQIEMLNQRIQEMQQQAPTTQPAGPGAPTTQPVSVHYGDQYFLQRDPERRTQHPFLPAVG